MYATALHFNLCLKVYRREILILFFGINKFLFVDCYDEKNLEDALIFGVLLTPRFGIKLSYEERRMTA